MIVGENKTDVYYLPLPSSPPPPLPSPPLTSLPSLTPCAGNRVCLKGYQGFLGGLDSEKGMTGESSVSTEFAGLDVMFHVAPLMPYDPNDPQQVRLILHYVSQYVLRIFETWLPSVSLAHPFVVCVGKASSVGSNHTMNNEGKLPKKTTPVPQLTCIYIVYTCSIVP